jgi:serine/threonine-protein kinase HipA
VSCAICLRPVEGGAAYPGACLAELFGRRQAPEVDVDLEKLHTLALGMVGRTSLSGIQRKVSLTLAAERGTFRLQAQPGNFILKPQAQTFPALPENEHVTMKLAALVGLETPACGLVRLRDQSLAFLVARFDRVPTGSGELSGHVKLAQEDFCQLAEKPPKEKYDGSAELCVRIVRRYASEPGIEMLKLFRAIVFAWWTGNGDMHLKNFSLLTGADGRVRLSPSYDQLSTRLVIPGDPLALPVEGKKDRLTRAAWLGLAAYAKIPERPAARVLDGVASKAGEARAMIGRSFLPEAMKQEYDALIAERSGGITAS